LNGLVQDWNNFFVGWAAERRGSGYLGIKGFGGGGRLVVLRIPKQELRTDKEITQRDYRNFASRDLHDLKGPPERYPPIMRRKLVI